MKTLPCLSPENRPCGEKRWRERERQRERERERGNKEKKANHVNRRSYTIFMISSEMFKVGQASRAVEGIREEIDRRG